ncbi:hypothetical protein FISHEDRAFT_67255 [Fistulina hepatica ATCC 64428]|uniref:phosphatidylserine decarboxylase n=1 Tax=Fistulina hepatica ATCC 64428 TaxID=1128425 RepID=A0A0D7A3R3_9AGAR|nr:hypothetical protein FISHEDRAFT_67255 [Fistulina hepatica ATCC 64428]
MVPGLEKLAAAYHVGNFVMVREKRQLVFEFMPLYARIGMHLLFYGTQQRKLLKTDWLQNLLKKQSVKQGIIYDSPSSRFAIPSFVKTWSIETDELLDPELDHYGCFNEFFYRRLKPGARPIDLPQDGICSVADCRLTVYENMSLAREFWVKGRNFTIPSLLNVSEDSPVARDFEDGSVAIFRLAPSDYHRFHSPIYCTVGNIHHVDGEYFTVNPQAVTQKGLDILTANIRSVLYLRDAYRGCPIAFVAVGALLVGSIKWTTGAKTGASVKRGDELGYFAYGGSTVVAVFPKDFVKYDDDLVENSKIPMETLVKAGVVLPCT